jgi:hypothetical protein
VTRSSLGALSIAIAIFAAPVLAAPADRTPYSYDAKEAGAYLDAMHAKIHPVYVKELARLDKLGPTQPFNDLTAYAVLFVILDGDGKILDVNMVKGTGVPELNQAIRRGFEGGGPFGKPPASLRSEDGKTRVRWEIHRDPSQHCAPTHAWPMIVVPG